MTEDEEKVLLEDTINYDMMSKQEGNHVLNVLLHTKEIANGIFNNEVGNVSKVYLKKEKDGKIYFSLVIFYENENRMYTGNVVFRKNKTYVMGNIYRDGKNVKDKDFDVYDTFTFKEDLIERKTAYSNNKKVFEDNIKLYSNDEIETFKKNSYHK